MDIEHAEHVSHAVGIVTAYVGQHHVPVHELPALIASVHGAVAGLGQSVAPAHPVVEMPTKKQIDASVRQDSITSFIDGRSYKTLRRHLTAHGLTPEQYLERFGLPVGYPMVAADYSSKRSELAKSLGLGQQRRNYPSSDKPALSAVA